MSTLLRILFIAELLIVASQISFSQTDSARVIRDTTIHYSVSGASDSSKQSSSDAYAFHMKKSPMLAVGLSAVIPGAGQIYDGGYWKAPLIWGVGGYWISQWIDLNNKYQQFRSAYAATIPSGGNPQYLSLRDFYRDERDRFAWFMGGLYFLNLLDAYVGAQLYDFEVSPDLGLDGMSLPKAGLAVKFRF